MDAPRQKETEAAYQKFRDGLRDTPEHLYSFNLQNETVVREFDSWVIIENRFPYDRMTRTNHMLVSKRPLQSQYHGSQEEQEEYHRILQLLAEEGFYDALIENFPKVKSVTKFAHTHLVQWNNTASEPQEDN